MRLSAGRFFGAGSRDVFQGRLETAEDGGLTGAITVRKTRDQTAPVLGQFKEATLKIRGSYDPAGRSFSWAGQAYGHHSIIIQGRGHELPMQTQAAAHFSPFKPGTLILLRHASITRPLFTGTPPGTVFASPLQRALQTAR